MSFSRPQQKYYRPLLRKAWTADCARSGVSPDDKIAFDAWYRNELFTAIGVWTTKELNQTDDYDSVMLHFAVIADDEYWITRMARGKERRIEHLINQRLADLDGIDQERRHDWTYARSIYEHMALPEHLYDCPAELLVKVFQALDTHVRRMRDRLDPVPF